MDPTNTLLANWDRILFFLIGVVIGLRSGLSRNPSLFIRGLTGLSLLILFFRYAVVTWMGFEWLRAYDFALAFAWGAFILGGGLGTIRVFQPGSWKYYFGNR